MYEQEIAATEIGDDQHAYDEVDEQKEEPSDQEQKNDEGKKKANDDDFWSNFSF